MIDQKHPNILLIITDQQSADVMSCRMGSRYISTPAMDRLAARGLLFSRAYCSSPLCVPSRMSMFSGRYPHETGVQSNDDLSVDVSGFPCMGAVFRDAGYDTGYVGKWHVPYSVQDREMHGFNFMENIRCNGADRHNSEAAIRFLQTKRDAPFFLVASYNNPHNICEWARGERGDLPDGTLGSPPPEEQCPPLKANHNPPADETDTVTGLRRSYQANPMFPVAAYAEQEWREYLWAYCRMVEAVDEQIGLLMQGLERSGQSKNTVVVFVSDHGDAQGAHRWNQKTVLYDESARVPFIICCPGKQAHGVSSRLAQVGIDLLPTLCDAAGITPPPDMPGVSLLGLSSVSGRPWIVSETRFVQGTHIDEVPPQVDGRMIRSQRYKYCVYDSGEHRESLVDMQQDSGEMRNLARDTDCDDILQEHRGFLLEFCSKTGDKFPA